MYNSKSYWTTFILSFPITGYISISAFASLLGIPIRTASFAIRLKICAKAARIKKYKSIIKLKKYKYDKIVLLAKFILNRIVSIVSISKALINSNISNNELVLVNNALKEYENVKEEIKKLKS